MEASRKTVRESEHINAGRERNLFMYAGSDYGGGNISGEISFFIGGNTGYWVIPKDPIKKIKSSS